MPQTRDQQHNQLEANSIKEEFQPDDQEVDVLLLAFEFEYSNISGLKAERDCIRKSFQRKGFKVKMVTIGIAESWNEWSGLGVKLRLFLSKPQALRIIYYHGYVRQSQDELELIR